MLSNYKAYKELYLQCFTDDTEADAEFLFKTVLSKAERICEYDKGKPIAMLFLMDCHLQSQAQKYPFYYLYAACTHPNYRGQGIMGRLLEKAKQKSIADGKLGVFLKPANPPLFNFYKQNGFEPFFKYTKIVCSAEHFLNNVNFNLGIAPITKMTIDEWYIRRKEPLNLLCDIYADFEGDLFTAATADCNAVFYSGAAIVYEQRDNTLLIKEAFCRKGNEKALLSLAGAVLAKTKLDNIELRLPAVYDPSAFEGLNPVTEAFSVIWHNGTLPQESFNAPYHGFAFD